MPYTVALPDGRTVEFPDSVSREDAAAIIRRQFGMGAQPKESTIGSELVRGAKQLVSTTRTGIGALTAPEEAARAGVERGQQIAAEAGEGPSLAALRKAYEERGLLPAAGELVSQIPRALAGQGAQLAAMAGGAKLGAMAGSAVLPGAGTLIGGALGAGATLLPQFFGSNVERQAAEQMGRGEPIQIDRGAAAAAAAGQAGIEAAGTALVLGKRVVKGILGITDDAALATAKAREELVKAAGRSRLGAAGRGAAVGLAEIPVEIAQAVIERAQAGLDVLSPEAITEYGENAYLAGLVGPTIGAATRVTEPGAARRKLAVEEQTQAAEARAAAAKAEAEKKKDPLYALKLDADYQAAVQRMKELQAAVPKKPGKGALPEEQMAYRQAVDARNAHLKDVLQPLAAEYVPRKAEIAQLKERQRVEAMSPLDYMLEQTETAPIKGIAPGEAPLRTEADTEIFPSISAPAPEAQYAQQQMDLAKQQDLGTFEAKDFAEYLMQDPAMAQRLVETKTAIPGVSKKESDAILGGLKLQLQDRVKQERAATQEELQQRQADLKAQQQPAETDPLAMWKASVEETEDQATEELLRPNFETLRPSGPATVAVAPGITPMQNPGTLLKRLDDLTAARDKAAADAETAFAAGNKELGVKKSQEREAAQSALNNIEQTEGTPRALVALRKAQDTALMNAAQLIDDLRVGRTLGGPEARTASSTPQTLINQINKQRDAFVTSAVQEAAATRRLFAKALTQEEAETAAKQMRDVFNEWVTRSMAQPRAAVLEERVTQPAQMRGTEVVRGAETEMVDPRPLEERRFGAYRAATQVLQEQLRQISSRLSEVPKEGRRVEPTLKMQFPETEAAKVAEASGETAQTLEGALRRRRDYVGGLIDQAFQTRKVPGIAQMLLTRVQDFLQKPLETKVLNEETGKEETQLQYRGTTGLLDAAENIASRILRGQNVERSDLVALRDEIRAESMRPGEAEVAGEREGQRELFPAEERRALAPKAEQGALGTIREKPEAFQAVRAKSAAKQQRADAAAARGEKLTQDIKRELDRIDTERQQALEARVDERRDSLQSAWQSAVKKAKDSIIAARRVIQKDKLKGLKTEIDAIRSGGIEGLNKETIDRLLALRQQADDLVTQFDAVVEAAEFLPLAQANKWVAFERGALDQAQKALEANRTPQTVSALAQQQAALRRAETARLQNLKGEEKAAEAARMRAAQQGLGLPGVRREAGKVTPIEPEKTAEQKRVEAEERRQQARQETAAAKVARDEERGALEQRFTDLAKQVESAEAAQKRARTPASKERIQTTIDALNKDLTLVRGQLAAAVETKPRKTGPATAPTSAALGKRTPMRTGTGEVQEEAARFRAQEANLVAAQLRAQTAKQKATAEKQESAIAKVQQKEKIQGETRVEGTLEREERLDSFAVGNKDIFFSRGTTESPSTTASVRTELSKAFSDLSRVQVYDSVDALVAANPQYEGRIPSDARGFVDTAGNKAFLIAENINKGDALAVLLHEVGAHIGLKNMLGTAQYNALVKAVETWAKKNDGSVESRVAKTALERVEAAKTPANQKDDETLAYAIEEAVKAGVKPMETKGVLGQWLSQIATLFRKALEKFGLPPKSLDAQGLVDMAFGAAKMEMTGAKPSTSKGDLLFTYAGERSGIAAEALKEAKEMTAQGAPMEEVWNKTGWFQSADKKWRFEIDDSKAKFRFDDYYDALKDGTLNADGEAELKLGNILWHPSLYKAYPALKDLPVKLYDNTNDRVLGSFGENGIKLNLTSPDSEGVLLHEIQHYIQGQEGFRSGSSTTSEYMRTYKKNLLQSVRESYVRMAETGDTASERMYYRERVVAMDAGIAAAEKARSESAKTIADARKEWQKDKKEIADAINNLGIEYERLRSKHTAALDAYSDAKLKFIKVAKSKTATTADKDAAWAEVQKADEALLATPKPDLKERLAEHDKLIDKESAAYKKYVGVTYAVRKTIDDALDTAIKAKLPSQSVFAAFARLGISEQAYQNVLGEVEARDVEERRTLSAEERAATRPYSSQPQRREEILFSRNLPTASRVADSLIAKEKGWLTKLKDNFLGMGGRTQFVDKLAPSEEALKRGGTDPTKALQAMYYLRMYDQRMHFTSQSITEGVPELVEKTRRDGTTERLIETKAGANIQQIVDILKGKDVVKAAGSPDAANKLFTLYLAAIRGERVGYDTLNFKVSEADIKAARAEIEADPTLKKAFDEARDIYNQYNRNLLEFSVQTGALSRAQANEYLRNNDYIPYYRMRNGVAEMVIGNETPIRIGNLKDSPHLKELVGGDEAIFDFLTSSVQNTSMLLDMATKNLATKNLMFELRDVGLATVAKVPKSGKTPEGAVTFKRDGEDHYAVVDTDVIGIDSDLLVKGLAGIPTMFPAFVRVLGVPARFLRRAVVASPVYMARQLFRDTLGATMTSGADIVPVLSALKQIGKPNVLQGRGITGGQVFTGMPEDVTRMLKDMQAGKRSITNGLSYLEAKAAQVDGLTRKAQYESYLKQGLSEMEATYMALESMNFSKRGLSPTMHMVSTLIPFFNAQIQGLDVLYKSFTGKMPLNERLDVRQKLWERGLMLAGLSVVYAMEMQDDETYKNAKPEEKYGNWFVPVPGFEQMVRLPIPFELGYIFKALPEALVNIALREDGAEEAKKALAHIALQTIPGASSYMLPQAVKTALEVTLDRSIFTGRSIESAQEQMMEPGYRYRDNTTALAREVGELTGFSPIKMEYLIRGYTGGMGMALLAALSAPFGGEGPEAATKRASDLPVVGTLFQPKDASGIIDATYERMKQVNQVKETYEGLLNKGRQADAEKYLKENIDEMALASVAGSFKQYMGQITEYERQIRASNMTPEKKREALDQARQAKIQLATSVRAAADRKAPQAVPA